MNRCLQLKYVLIVVIPVAMIVNSAPVQARTIHVATTGNDDHAGSAEAPLATIQKAVSLARAGDTVLVRGGVYKGHVILQFSGEADKPIVLKNAPGEKPVLDGEGRGRIELKLEHGWRKAIGWITVEGIEVKNGWDGIKFYNSHNITLRGNYLHDNLNQGILGNGHHVRIEGNTIVRNGFKADNERSNLEHGIYCTGTDFSIVNNVIHSNKAYGIQVAGYPHKPDDQPGVEFGGARCGSSATTPSRSTEIERALWSGSRTRPTASSRTTSSTRIPSRSAAARCRGSISSARERACHPEQLVLRTRAAIDWRGAPAHSVEQS